MIKIIANQYKKTLNDFIHSWNLAFLDFLQPIDKIFGNTIIFESSLLNLLKKNCLNKNFSNKLL